MLPTFPSRYWFTIGLPGVFSLAGWSPQFRTGFHVPRPTQVVPAIIPVTRTGLSPSTVALSKTFWFPNESLVRLLQPLGVRKHPGLGSAPFARHYSGYRLFFLFLRVLRCFSSPGSPTLTSVLGLQPSGLPHSDMLGSIPVCRSPSLFAAYHVFHRLRIA